MPTTTATRWNAAADSAIAPTNVNAPKIVRIATIVANNNIATIAAIATAMTAKTITAATIAIIATEAAAARAIRKQSFS